MGEVILINRILLACSILSLMACSSFRPSFISDNSWAAVEKEQAENGSNEPRDLTSDDIEGPTNGHFDDEGNWIPDNPSIEFTYQIPDISAGFIFDIATQDITPSIQIELLEFDTPLPWPISTYKIDAGVAYQRAYIYFGPRITSIFEISVGGFCGWNWEEKDISYGVGFTLIRF